MASITVPSKPLLVKMEEWVPANTIEHTKVGDRTTEPQRRRPSPS
jgi:hypothetical protein